MRSTYFLGLFYLGAAAALAVGCGDDGETDGSGGAGGGGVTSSTSTSSTSTGVTSTSSTGGGRPDGNDSAATAEDLDIGAPAVDGTLEPVGTDVDYYKFTGTRGQALFFITDAKPSSDETSSAYPDLVITLLDAQENQIARNDDPELGRQNDSELITVLPADGDYYLRVEECNSALGPDSCADASEIVNTEYTLQVLELDPDLNSIVPDTEPNNSTDQAVPLEYEPTQDGERYFTTFVVGNFESAADVDVYSFTLPTDPPVSNALMANFFFYGPTGTEGNGSTVDVSEIAVYEAADLTNAYAKVDPRSGGDIGVPVEGGVEYFVFVRRPAGATGANDFYVVTHARSDSDPVEAEEVTNNVPATPEGLTAFPNLGGGESFSVQGSLPDGAAADVDLYALPLPNGADATWTVSAICTAQRDGSGVRDLKVEILNGDGAVINAATHTGTETDAEDLLVDGVAIPANPAQSRLIGKVSAGTPAADVTNRSYNCLFAYLPPQE